MSENLDLVRSIYAGWERGDFGSAAWANPRIEFAFIGGLEPTTGLGLAALAGVMRAFLGTWDAYRVEAEGFRELDGDRVLVLSRATGRGKTSGLDVGDVAGKGAHLFHVHGGKVTRLVLYWDRDRALADLGLAE
jgi:ketosteroid isomerase-like protein